MSRLLVVLFLVVLCGSRLVGQVSTVTWVQQPSNASAEAAGSAQYSFTVRSPIAFANLTVGVQKVNGGSVASRFTVVSQSIGNVVSTAGNYAEGAFTVQISNVTAADAGTYFFQIGVNGLLGTPSSNQVTLSIVAVLPPTITSQPTSVTVGAGREATFRVTATGSGTLSYQWRKNGSPVAGATGTAFTISNVQNTDAANYTVAVTNAGGTTVSSSATLTVTVEVAPTITRQPASQSVASFSPVSLSVAATGNPAPTFQWFRNGVALAAENGTSLSFTFTVGRNAGAYHVVVANSSGSVVSSTAILAVTSDGSPAITRNPDSADVLAGQSVSFSVGLAPSVFTPAYQWLFNGSTILGASASTYTVLAAPATAGAYSVLVMNEFGSVTSSSATLRIVSAVLPTITSQPVSRTVLEGESTVLSVTAAGTPVPTYQWFKDGAVIASATSSSLSVPAVSLADAGAYTVVISNSSGSVTSNSARVTVTPRPPEARITNLSVRTSLGAGQNLIVGFATSDARSVLVRAAGPALAALGLGGTMSDPRAELYSGSALVFENDDWPASLGAVFASAGAFAFPANSRDAAFIQDVSGGRSVHVRGTSGGVVLVEAYDLGAATARGRLTNVSARNRVGTGDDILIAGFNVTGAGARQLVIRAVGPRLADFGVTGVLGDPVLQVFSSAGEVIALNDDWASSLAPTFAAVGAFSLIPGSRDAAVLFTAQSGSYTIQVRGANGGTGEALVEIYEVP